MKEKIIDIKTMNIYSYNFLASLKSDEMAEWGNQDYTVIQNLIFCETLQNGKFTNMI